MGETPTHMPLPTLAKYIRTSKAALPTTDKTKNKVRESKIPPGKIIHVPLGNAVVTDVQADREKIAKGRAQRKELRRQRKKTGKTNAPPTPLTKRQDYAATVQPVIWVN